MPSKPSSPKPHQKVLQTTDTAGWTHIVKGSQAQKKQKYRIPWHPTPNHPPKGLTIEIACVTLQKFRKTLEESTFSGKMKAILESQSFLATAELHPITRCVCLGLGTITGFATSYSRSPLYQLAFLIFVLDILGTKHKIENIYVQDPMFNHIDIGVLETLGFTILETPDAFQKMTRETFLFDPHLEWKHTARALDVAHPCLRIGNMIPIDVSCSTHMTSQEKESIQRYSNDHAQMEIPGPRDARWSSSLAIFWPRPSNDESEIAP